MDLRHTIRMMGIPLEGPAWMFGDNSSIITSSNIPSSKLNKRHQILSYHRVREAIASRILFFNFVKSENNMADALTKFLPKSKLWPIVGPLLFWKGETSLGSSQLRGVTRENKLKVSWSDLQQSSQGEEGDGQTAPSTDGCILNLDGLNIEQMDLMFIHN